MGHTRSCRSSVCKKGRCTRCILCCCFSTWAGLRGSSAQHCPITLSQCQLTHCAVCTSVSCCPPQKVVKQTVTHCGVNSSSHVSDASMPSSRRTTPSPNGTAVCPVTSATSAGRPWSSNTPRCFHVAKYLHNIIRHLTAAVCVDAHVECTGGVSSQKGMRCTPADLVVHMLAACGRAGPSWLLVTWLSLSSAAAPYRVSL